MARKPAHEQFDTLRMIEDKAFELFGSFGYDGVSIGDIAKSAKLSKGALYWHFDSKEALYLSCLKRLHGIFDECVFEPMRSEPNPGLSILALFNGVARLLRDPRVEQGIAGYWLIPSRPDNDRLLTAQRQFEQSAVQSVRESLARGMDAGIIDMSEDDPDELARAIMSLVEACALPLRHQSPEEVRGTLRSLARALFRAYAKLPDMVRVIDNYI